MTDHPIREPEPPDARLDRTDEVEPEQREQPPTRPSAAEGKESDGGPRPPRPSQAEGERED